MVEFHASSLLFVEVMFAIISHGSSRPQFQAVLSQKTDKELSKREFQGYLKTDSNQLSLPASKDIHNALRNDFTNNGFGNYFFSYETSSYARSEVGELRNAGTDNEIQVVKGQYQVKATDANGFPILKKISYTFEIAVESKPPTGGGGFGVLGGGPAAGAPGTTVEPQGPPTDGISSACLGSLCGGNIG